MRALTPGALCRTSRENTFQMSQEVSVELLVMPVVLVAAFILIRETLRLHGEWRKRKREAADSE
jgi:hypothetical protein